MFVVGRNTLTISIIWDLHTYTLSKETGVVETSMGPGETL